MNPAAWRSVALGGAAGGLALAVPAADGRLNPLTPLAVALAAAVVLVVARPRSGPSGLWLVAVALAAAVAGLGAGVARLNAIDGGAYSQAPGSRVTAVGYVAAVPKRSDGTVTVRVDTAEGRLLVEAPEPVADLRIGAQVRASGTVRAPQSWEASYLARYGIERVLQAASIELTGARRGGAAGVADGIRNRAEDALGSGTPAAEASLLRGFVLGEDDRIDPATVDDFKRAGLAHLLAVSGDCVMLLALLAMGMLALGGVPLRARLWCVLAVIAVYVPVAGAGPSIQRAGIMGAAGIAAALADRPRARGHAMALAAVVTLALDPRAVTDPSWQLSFAAVTGIALFARRIARLLAHEHASAVRRVLAEGAGVTIAATLTTAPLFAHYFGAVSPASLPANLLALPAIAPMMWLAMLAAIAGQVPGLPVEPLTGLAGLLAAYVAQVAHWMAAPGWAQVGVSLPSWGQVAAAYAGIGAAMAVALAWAERRRGGLPRASSLRRLGLAGGAAAAIVLGLSPRASAPPVPGLRVVVMDVGQGDAILLDPRAGPPLLVDGGPPGDGLAAHLSDLGVGHLGAAMVTHDQSDHAGGLAELLGAEPIHRLVYAVRAPELLARAHDASVATIQVAEGSELDSGALRLEVLWPPRDALVRSGAAGSDPNLLAIVALARWHGFSMLLTADAEAESVPYDPGPVDVLKVAHHGSDDAGLDDLLARIVPSLAVISVGADNSYGHPTAGTLATLASHGVPVRRTDEDGDVELDVGRRGFQIR